MMAFSFDKVIDLTQPLSSGMSVYPGDPLVSIEEVAHLDSDGFTVARIQLNDHAGTHMETQYHMMGGRTLIDEPPTRFVGMATVVRVEKPKIEVTAIQHAEEMIRRHPFVLLHTGYSSRTIAIDPDDPDRPVVSVEALEWLCGCGVQLLGIDAFDFDSGPPYPGHHLLFENGVMVIEGLVNLGAISGREVFVVALPLKIAGTGGAPCRVLAFVDEQS